MMCRGEELAVLEQFTFARISHVFAIKTCELIGRNRMYKPTNVLFLLWKMDFKEG